MDRVRAVQPDPSRVRKYMKTVNPNDDVRAEAVKAVFEKLFHHYDMPKIIRSHSGISAGKFR